LIVAPAAADDRVCFDKNSLPDAQIAACSRLLSMGKFRGSNLAHIYGWRGNSYVGKGEYDRAIADYDEVIGLDPKYASAYNGRGFAYHSRGDDERAIADYDEAIRLDPKSATVVYEPLLCLYFKKIKL
jgi:tetratricopeptide (TPR) repeat protein